MNRREEFIFWIATFITLCGSDPDKLGKMIEVYRLSLYPEFSYEEGQTILQEMTILFKKDSNRMENIKRSGS